MSGLQQLMMSNFSGASNEAIIGTAATKSLGFFSVGKNEHMCYNPDNDVFVIFSSNASSNGYCYAAKINADNTVTVGSTYSFDTGDVDDLSAAYDTNVNKMVVLYRKDSSDEQIFARVVNAASNLTITFGTRVTLDSSGNLADTSIAFAPDVNRFLAMYEDDDGTDNALFRNIQANSNNTITLRTAGTIQAGNQSYGDPNVNREANYGNGIVANTFLHNPNRVLRGFNVTSTSTSIGPALNWYSTYNPVAAQLQYVSSTSRWYGLSSDVTVNANGTRLHVASNSGTTFTNRGNVKFFNERVNGNADLAYEPTTNQLIAVCANYSSTNRGTTKIHEITPTASGGTLTNTHTAFAGFSGVTQAVYMVGAKIASNGKLLIVTREPNSSNVHTNNHTLRAFKPTGL